MQPTYNPDLVERMENDWLLSQDLQMDLFYTADEKDIQIMQVVIVNQHHMMIVIDTVARAL